MSYLNRAESPSEVLGKQQHVFPDGPRFGWHDILGAPIVRGVGANDPTFEQINATPFNAYNFAVNDQMWFAYHVPHDYVPNTDILLHAHWLPDGTDSNPVRWEWTYTYAPGFNQLAYNLTGTTVFKEQTVGGTQYQSYTTESDLLTLGITEPDGIIYTRVRRITNGAVDNTDGIYLLTADVHYQSTGRPTAGRQPDFYQET